MYLSKYTMLSNELKKLFKKWKLYEKEWVFYSIIHYENPFIKIERVFKKNDKEDKHKMHLLLIDIFYDYEYNNEPMWLVPLSILCWVTHPTVLNNLNWAIEKMRAVEEEKERMRLKRMENELGTNKTKISCKFTK